MVQDRRSCAAQAKQLRSGSAEKARSITRSKQVYERGRMGTRQRGPTGLDIEGQLVLRAWREKGGNASACGGVRKMAQVKCAIIEEDRECA